MTSMTNVYIYIYTLPVSGFECKLMIMMIVTCQYVPRDEQPVKCHRSFQGHSCCFECKGTDVEQTWTVDHQHHWRQRSPNIFQAGAAKGTVRPELLKGATEDDVAMLKHILSASQLVFFSFPGPSHGLDHHGLPTFGTGDTLGEGLVNKTTTWKMLTRNKTVGL